MRPAVRDQVVLHPLDRLRSIHAGYTRLVHLPFTQMWAWNDSITSAFQLPSEITLFTIVAAPERSNPSKYSRADDRRACSSKTSQSCNCAAYRHGSVFSDDPQTVVGLRSD